MTSTFGWLDTDSEQRRTMLEVVDLFKEEGTVDELGIGSIRDALSGALFPGTSVLHTRLRYVLFIPWQLQQAAHKSTPAEMSAEFRRLEIRLIKALLEGGERQGVVGNTARDKLKRFPSAMYWAALGAWGIVPDGLSAEGFFRKQHDYRQLQRRTSITDDPEAREILPGGGLDPNLPAHPEEWVSAVTFALTPVEADYLSDRIVESAPSSMFAWLINHQPSHLPNFVWELPEVGQAPEHLKALSDHARRFSITIHGAALLYNLLLARKSGQDERADGYTEALQDWQQEVHLAGVLDGWDRAAWWSMLHGFNPHLRPATRRFVNDWIDVLEGGQALEQHAGAQDLIERRERAIKGSRARLANQAALDRWSGASGLGRHDFRWQIARSHLADLYQARSTA